MIPDGDQEAAVNYEGKQALIIAGPGTGKTAVLTARIFRLLKEGRDPASILALTFTVKAATELRERIMRGSGSPGPMAATFHSLCCSLLREYPAIAPEGFQIIGEAERAAILEDLCAQGKGRLSPQRLGNYIEERKRFLLLPGETEPRLGPYGESLLREPWVSFHPAPADTALEERYRQYRQRLRAANLVDYDDLPLGTIRLLCAKAEVLGQVRMRYRYILVDEYQDINFAQYILIRLLAPNDAGPELRVIGDPNQAIYAFRGSDKRFLERFFQDYPEAKRFNLSRSFRCAAPLMEAANRLTKAGLRGNSGTRISILPSIS
jgi:superfamily I DNA/RNA helicase